MTLPLAEGNLRRHDPESVLDCDAFVSKRASLVTTPRGWAATLMVLQAECMERYVPCQHLPSIYFRVQFVFAKMQREEYA